MKQKGFTLIEILIALAIFAILATLTSSSIYYAFTTRSKVNDQADRLNQLQLAVSIIQQDTAQSQEYAVRGNDMHVFPAFIGTEKYLEFTRSGVVNPGEAEQSSHLKRVALVCSASTLVRRTWFRLHAVDRKRFQDKVLIDNLSNCHFNYLNQSLSVLSEWKDQAVSQTQRKEPLPKAIQIQLTLKDWGKMSMLFAMPGAVYAPA